MILLLIPSDIAEPEIIKLLLGEHAKENHSEEKGTMVADYTIPPEVAPEPELGLVGSEDSYPIHGQMEKIIEIRVVILKMAGNICLKKEGLQRTA